MREIKFRAWNGSSFDYSGNFWMSADGYSAGFNGEGNIEFTNLPLMQFTGLTDRNGVDIYEGDLIEVLRNKKGALQVEFINDYVGGWVLTHPSSNGHISLGARNRLDIEVVGNIYQNPELIENTNK